MVEPDSAVGTYMPEDAAVRRAPDEPCVIKAIMVIADSAPGLAASSDETRGGRQVGIVASRMILRAVTKRPVGWSPVSRAYQWPARRQRQLSPAGVAKVGEAISRKP